MAEKKTLSVFEKMKKVEEFKRKRMIAKVLTKVKELAKEIQEDKELCNLYLEQVAKTDKERKQIIDWINELEDVKPDEDRLKELRESVKQVAKTEKAEVEEKMKKDPEKFLGDNMFNGLAYNTSYDPTNLVLCSSATSTTLSNSTGGISVQ